MKQQLFLINLWLISTVSILTVAPVWARGTETVLTEERNSSVVSSAKIAQSTSSTNSPIKVTAVELYQTEAGLEVVLKTPNPKLLKPA
ncbi:MAG: hypothetical protein AAF757_26850, partial [Cyanobacteria bacterium P01_D01_bin.116]